MLVCIPERVTSPCMGRNSAQNEDKGHSTEIEVLGIWGLFGMLAMRSREPDETFVSSRHLRLVHLHQTGKKLEGSCQVNAITYRNHEQSKHRYQLFKASFKVLHYLLNCSIAKPIYSDVVGDYGVWEWSCIYKSDCTAINSFANSNGCSKKNGVQHCMRRLCDVAWKNWGSMNKYNKGMPWSVVRSRLSQRRTCSYSYGMHTLNGK